ncbi:hypothetical protein GGU10DRAFT_192563 [Lentinula aff. detonsa]|uniref:Uncharacterized protein n=1 Tax=Lentinula aff. detonsa TaxID=2804958 RepID=A0AA38ND09_9AGAR|nr:hypothetical protein GGU10DRAFT_192563 [Lentinula aff. detonsa]
MLNPQVQVSNFLSAGQKRTTLLIPNSLRSSEISSFRLSYSLSIQIMRFVYVMAFVLGLLPLSYAVPVSGLVTPPHSPKPVIASFMGGSAAPASDEDRQSAINILEGYVKPLYGGREIQIFGSFYHFVDKDKTTVQFTLTDTSRDVIPSLRISCIYCRGVARRTRTAVELVSGPSNFQRPAQYEGKLTTDVTGWPTLA